ncbi:MULTISPECIES: hypothetical protein [Roseobacteraceae]|uniref:hypothetical protein n=1 Tax=Roseobacteraceae TaxID=2854170 RepID=UPI0031DE24BF
MTVSVKSIFDAPLKHTALCDGVFLGECWHQDIPIGWSCEEDSTIFFESHLPPGSLFALEYCLYNASEEAPKTLKVKSPGRKEVEHVVTSGQAHFIVIESPAHQPGARQTPLNLHVNKLDSPAKLGRSTDDRLLGLQLLSLAPLAAKPAFPIMFSNAESCKLMLTTGWSSPDPTGVWALGDYSKIVLPGYLNDGVRFLTFEFGTLPNAENGHPPMSVSIEVNGAPLIENILAQKNSRSFTINLKDIWRESQSLSIGLRTYNAQSPAELGINEDPRPLGIFLSTIRAK